MSDAGQVKGSQVASFFGVSLWEYDQKARLSDEQYKLLKGFLAWASTQYVLVSREQLETLLKE